MRKEGEDAFVRIGQALDSFDNQQLTSDSRVPVIRRQQQDTGSLGNHSQMSFYTSEPLVTSDASVKRLCNDSDEIEAQIPSELITSCVAALLMIQVIWRLYFNLMYSRGEFSSSLPLNLCHACIGVCEFQ